LTPAWPRPREKLPRVVRRSHQLGIADSGSVTIGVTTARPAPARPCPLTWRCQRCKWYSRNDFRRLCPPLPGGALPALADCKSAIPRAKSGRGLFLTSRDLAEGTLFLPPSPENGCIPPAGPLEYDYIALAEVVYRHDRFHRLAASGPSVAPRTGPVLRYVVLAPSQEVIDTGPGTHRVPGLFSSTGGEGALPQTRRGPRPVAELK